MTSRPKIFRDIIQFEITLFMVFSVTYTICEGPKLDA